MSEKSEYVLPIITEQDILKADTSDIVDSLEDASYTQRWTQLLSRDSRLANLILYDAYHSSEGQPALQTKLLRAALRAISILNTAGQREKSTPDEVL